jgi:type II secretory pathway pseudopilin PulG
MIQKNMRLRRAINTGGTLVEILAVTLITAIMMAIAVSMFLTAQASAATLKCRSNMMLLGNIDQEYKVQNSTHAYSTSLTALATEVPNVPICPNGGTYTITISTGTSIASNGQTVPAGKILISCSYAGHGVYAPDIDTN